MPLASQAPLINPHKDDFAMPTNVNDELGLQRSTLPYHKVKRSVPVGSSNHIAFLTKLESMLQRSRGRLSNGLTIRIQSLRLDFLYVTVCDVILNTKQEFLFRNQLFKNIQFVAVFVTNEDLTLLSLFKQSYGLFLAVCASGPIVAPESTDPTIKPAKVVFKMKCSLFHSIGRPLTEQEQDGGRYFPKSIYFTPCSSETSGPISAAESIVSTSAMIFSTVSSGTAACARRLNLAYLSAGIIGKSRLPLR